MPLIKGFRSTNVWKAFTLNSLANALMVTAAAVANDKLSRFRTRKTIKKLTHKLESDKDSGDKCDTICPVFDPSLVRSRVTWQGTLYTFLIAFATCFSAYTLLHFVFGFGEGQLA